LIYQLSHSGVTVFVTTHYMDEAEHCNTIGFIYAGKLVALGSPSELKTKLDAFSFYEILTDHPIEAMDVLQQQPWVNETTIFGSAFHVSVVGQHDAHTKIRRALVGASRKAEKIDRIAPSLEDVFIHLIAEEDKRTADRRQLKSTEER
jgi:ABC-2 type transport system ATP-binding protein